MSGYRRGGDPSGWDMALQGMNFLSNSMQAGQRIGAERRRTDEEDGVNQAYEYIAGKLGTTGDISALDGDPVLNTRHGTMAMGQFMQQRAGTENSRLQMLNAMETSDNQFYQNTFRPMAFAAQEAFQAGDMQRFAGIAGELSAKSPMPFRLIPGQDGNFNVAFRSDTAGGWTDTGRKLSPQQTMDEIGNIIGGEQTILAGADMKPRPVNPRFLAASARYKMGTIMGNAQAMADPKRWVPLTKDGHTVYAIPQNRHDDYSVAPSYRVLDENSGSSYMAGSMDELLSQGYVRSDVKAATEKAQRLATGGGRGSGGTAYAISESDNKFISQMAIKDDGLGNKIVDTSMGIALQTLMGTHGLTGYAAMEAYQKSVDALTKQRLSETPQMSPEQAYALASQDYCNWLARGGRDAAPTTPATTPATASPQNSAAAQRDKRIQEAAHGGGTNQVPTPQTTPNTGQGTAPGVPGPRVGYVEPDAVQTTPLTLGPLLQGNFNFDEGRRNDADFARGRFAPAR